MTSINARDWAVALLEDRIFELLGLKAMFSEWRWGLLVDAWGASGRREFEHAGLASTP